MPTSPSPYTRSLGSTDLDVSAMGLGCWAIGGPFWDGDDALGWGETDDEESIRAIQRGLDLGITFFDTADVYGAGHSERLLARALQGHRDDVVIATKFGNVFDETTRQVTGQDASPDYVRRACEASLQRLRTDRIDLYQFHLNDYDPERAPEVRDVLEELVAEGKIRYYGWSTDFPERARLFAKGEHCVAIQHQMNVIDDAAEVIAVCEASGLASINRGPLAMGLLTGKYRPDSTLEDEGDVRGTHSPVWMQYFQEGRPSSEWLQKVETVREILTAEGRTLTQGALGWLWARSEQTLPIPGFRTAEQVQENAGALQHGPLSDQQMREIDAVLGR